MPSRPKSIIPISEDTPLTIKKPKKKMVKPSFEHSEEEEEEEEELKINIKSKLVREKTKFGPSFNEEAAGAVQYTEEYLHELKEKNLCYTERDIEDEPVHVETTIPDESTIQHIKQQKRKSTQFEEFISLNSTDSEISQDDDDDDQTRDPLIDDSIYDTQLSDDEWHIHQFKNGYSNNTTVNKRVFPKYKTLTPLQYQLENISTVIGQLKETQLGIDVRVGELEVEYGSVVEEERGILHRLNGI